ncbi:23S rRNA (uracil(1939)-C(5))-methyltransferase RlmD [Paenibacillus sp.]|uniref:23S rRNA (uracil(1939)-C(5))-methyltransferase RlmD n=1 Tax=Paenibacillus sp. TaxID=58172 RepID=UPI002D6119BF|nr:23S rRNA (uracil(1939)-C(5))-methyltransferase RlmD [Paenibacillus sp.]HZG83515.1 23S rRNA (uracil(1939)-C(5))-methyltransferase RlmD [Paenibacillus sp.]
MKRPDTPSGTTERSKSSGKPPARQGARPAAGRTDRRQDAPAPRGRSAERPQRASASADSRPPRQDRPGKPAVSGAAAAPRPGAPARPPRPGRSGPPSARPGAAPRADAQAAARPPRQDRPGKPAVSRTAAAPRLGAPAPRPRPADGVTAADADRLNAGDTVVVTVKRLGINGEGVGYYRKKAIFVDGALPGEVVRARITKVEPKLLYGEIVKTEKRSPDRVDPFCAWYDACGGCSVQHLAYAAQLREKEAIVREAFSRYAGIEEDKLPIAPVAGMDEPRAYRNKAQLQLGVGEGGEVLAGLYAPGSRRLVDIAGCPVQHGAVNDVMLAVKRIVGELKLPIADARTYGKALDAAPEDGEYAVRAPQRPAARPSAGAKPPRRGPSALRTVVARAARDGGEVQLTFVTTGTELPSERALVNAIRRELPAVVSIAHNVNSDDTPLVFGDKTRVVWGAERMKERLGELTFELSPRAFFQLNPDQTAKLYDRAKAAAALTGAETVVDAYSGVGTIALWLARGAAEVRGIEAVPEAVEDARRNAKANGIENASFHAGRAEELLPSWAEAGFRPDVVVVDPPRSGCDRQLLDALTRVRPKRIVYVSCNPSTLAKDAAVLLAHGRYRLASVEPVDMFPHTAHVECCALFVRKDA